MEERLDGLMALLTSKQAGEQASPSETSSAPSQPPIALSPPETGLQAFTHPISSSVSLVSFSGSEDFRPQQSLPVFAFPNFDQFNDAISKGLVSITQAEKSVRYFQSRASHFPFVLVPPKWTLDSLRRERPFLLLSILSFAAHHNEKVQLRLELELRESLSKKVIVHCEKSLDLLQGVLLYLAWYLLSIMSLDVFHFADRKSGINSTLNLTGNKCINFRKWLLPWPLILVSISRHRTGSRQMSRSSRPDSSYQSLRKSLRRRGLFLASIS
jgi:hypothetical protein